MKLRIIILKLVGIIIAIMGFVPLAKRLNPWRKEEQYDQFVAAYFYHDILKLSIFAGAGIALGYIFYRLGSHFASQTDKTSAFSAKDNTKIILTCSIGVVLLVVIFLLLLAAQKTGPHPIIVNSTGLKALIANRSKNHESAGSTVFRTTRTDFPPAEIRIIPTAFSSSMNGGVHVNVGGDPNNAASWKYTLVFDPDGKLSYYCRGN
jgi:hypothetical protein